MIRFARARACGVCLLVVVWLLLVLVAAVARGRLRAALFSRALVWLLSALCCVLTYVCVRVRGGFWSCFVWWLWRTCRCFSLAISFF